MSSSPTVIDHGSSRPGRWLRANRVRITLWVGAIEGVLVLIGALPHLAVYLLAIVAIGFYALVGRKYTSPSARNLTWIFATSQLIAVLVPAVLHVAKWIAITAIIVVAVVGLVLLFTDRDKA
jgi:hypothetical protein